jgi:hypothetical protein
MIEQLERAKVEKYLGKDITGILNNPAPEPIPILDKGILVKGSRACIYAKPKVGKSLFAVQMGLCCASGLSFLDIAVTQKVNVLYLNFEIDDYMLEQRIIGIKGKLMLDEVPQFRKLTLLGEDVPLLDTDAGLGKVYDILEVHNSRGFHVDLLIWDCRYKTVNKSEIQDDILKLWCRNMEELIKDFHFSPLIVHHEGKNTLGVGAGSNTFDRWVNTAIQIVPHHWQSALLPSKEKKVYIGGNYTAGYEQCVVLDFPVHCIGGYEVWQKSMSKKEKARIFILETLQDRAMPQEELERKAGAMEITRSTFFQALRELEKWQQIRSRQDPDKSGRHNIVELVAEPAELTLAA